MSAIIIYKGKDNALIFQVSNNSKSKEKQIVKEKKPNSDNEDERSNLTHEGWMKKVKKKGISSNCSY